MSNIPITAGSGTASVATEQIATVNYQQVKLVDGTVGSTTPLIVNSDGTLNARISGSVLSAGSTFNGSVSGTVGASIIGSVPVQTANTSIIAVIQGSVAVSGTVTAAGNQSVSGTVGASVIGTVPVNIVAGGTTGSVSGTVGASVIGWVPIQPSNTSVIGVAQGSVAVAIVSGSIAATFTPPANQSVSGTVQTDVRGSVATVIIGGSIAATVTPAANQSVSGTVGASIIGHAPVVIVGGSIAASFTPPANQSVSGTVQTDVIGSVAVAIISGSIAASFTPPANQSVSGTVGASIIGTVPVTGATVANQSVSGTVGASIIGLAPVSVSNLPTTQNVSGSVVSFLTSGSIIATQLAGSVLAVSGSFSPAGNQSVSGTVGASIIGTAPVTQAGTWIASVFGNVSVLGTVPVTQSTSPWVITGSVQGTATANQSVSGTVGASVIGSVPVRWESPSIVGTFAEDDQHNHGAKGLFTVGVRNDSLASVQSSDEAYQQFSLGPAGETIIAEAPLTNYILGTADLRVVQGASVTAIAAQGATVRTFVRRVQVSNFGPSSVLVKISDNTTSTLGWTIAPAGGGSNFDCYYKGAANSPITASINGTASVLVSMQGFTAKV